MKVRFPKRKPFSIIRDRGFKPTNEALDASLKDLARQWLISSTKYKRPISKKDLEAFYAANQLDLDTSESLVNAAWFYTVLYFGKRDRENQRAMKRGDLQLKTTTGGHKYFILNERATKNHPGRTNDNEDETQSVMMAWPGNPRCPVTRLEKYLAKREPQCAMLCGRIPKTTTRVHSPLLTISGSAAYLWENTSLKICSRICARKLVWHKFILLIA